jgi:hypothetical protein
MDSTKHTDVRVILSKASSRLLMRATASQILHPNESIIELASHMPMRAAENLQGQHKITHAEMSCTSLPLVTVSGLIGFQVGDLKTHVHSPCHDGNQLRCTNPENTGLALTCIVITRILLLVPFGHRIKASRLNFVPLSCQPKYSGLSIPCDS